MTAVLRISVALLIGFAVFFVLAPTSGSGIGCSSLLVREVPCDGVLAGSAGVVASLVTGLGLWLLGRRRGI